jgi:hypothetical protein
MIAIELEAPIIDHRLDVTSLELPAHVTKARVIVLYEGLPEDKPITDIDGILARSRGILGNHSMDEIDAELSAMRNEWRRDWDMEKP